jgi:hypothetical protein
MRTPSAVLDLDAIVARSMAESKRMDYNHQLPLRHARQAKTQPILRSLVAQAELEEWPLLRDLPDKPLMLCKFKGRLTPEQMKQDLEFTSATDNEPYRERLIVW